MSDEINDWSGRAPGGTGSVVPDEAGYYRDMAAAYKATAEERAQRIDELLDLSGRLLHWCKAASEAMSKVAPDAPRFESLQDHLDELRGKLGPVIRHVLKEHGE